MDFDRCTGQISNYSQMVFPDEGATGGVAFSPDDTKLYVSDREEIYQFDLLAPDIKASRQLVAEYDGFLDEWEQPSHFGLMKLAPNGKIYICSTTAGTQYMHAIDQPNELGEACDVQQHSVLLPTRNNRSLPNHPTYRLGPLEGSPCDTIDFTSTVEKVEKTTAVEVHPNPISQNGAWTLTYRPVGKREATVTLFNNIGQEVLNKALPFGGEYTISAEGLTTGLYFYEVQSGSRVVGSGKLVVK
jgi:hypothetical protein